MALPSPKIGDPKFASGNGSPHQDYPHSYLYQLYAQELGRIRCLLPGEEFYLAEKIESAHQNLTDLLLRYTEKKKGQRDFVGLAFLKNQLRKRLVSQELDNLKEEGLDSLDQKHPYRIISELEKRIKDLVAKSERQPSKRLAQLSEELFNSVYYSSNGSEKNSHQRIEFRRTIPHAAQNLVSRIESQGQPAENLENTKQEIILAISQLTRLKKELVEKNLRLVFLVAGRYVNLGLEYLDLIQEGNLGLINAVDGFNYKLGYKFSTYASKWIKQVIGRALADKSHQLRIPVHLYEELINYDKLAKKKTQEKGQIVYLDKLIEQADEPIPHRKLLLAGARAKRPTLSLDQPVGLDREDTWNDLIADEKALIPYLDCEGQELKDDLSIVLAKFNPRNASILKMCYGLGYKDECTLEETGSHFNLTRERIRQVREETLDRMRPHQRRLAAHL